MDIRFATKDEINDWNKKILSNPDGGNVFQSYELSEQKRLKDRWMPIYLVYKNIYMTVLSRNVFGLGTIWYIPKGPGITTAQELKEIIPEIRRIASKNKVFFVKIEPELKKDDKIMLEIAQLNLTHVQAIQPNTSTVILDMSKDLETVMSSINQKSRHAIKRALRDGAKAEPVPATEENCKIMFDLLYTTAENNFTIRSYDYYKDFWQRYERAGLGSLFFTYYDNAVVASAFAIAYGEKGLYKDGASIRKRTVYGASHLLQWRIIEWMKQKNIKTYDFCGTPPASEINNPDHSFYGLGRFKTSFNKEVTDYIGAYDIVIKPTNYKLWTTIGERLARRINLYFNGSRYYY